MTITINDTRNTQKGILWGSLEAGHVYIDKNGWYVMCLEDCEWIVNLANGETTYNQDYDIDCDKFIPVKCRLEIFG